MLVQLTAICLTVVGVVIIIADIGEFESGRHQNLGISVLVLCLVQVSLGYVSCRHGTRQTNRHTDTHYAHTQTHRHKQMHTCTCSAHRHNTHSTVTCLNPGQGILGFTRNQISGKGASSANKDDKGPRCDAVAKKPKRLLGTRTHIRTHTHTFTCTRFHLG